MKKAFERLNKKGIAGSLLFWVSAANITIPSCLLIIFIIWLCYQISGIWLEAVGYELSILTIIEFVLVASSVSYIYKGLTQKSHPEFSRQLGIFLSIISLIFLTVVIHYTNTDFNTTYYNLLNAYASSRTNYQTVIDWKSRTANMQIYVQNRVNDWHLPLIALFISWLVSTILFIILSFVVDCDNKEHE